MLYPLEFGYGYMYAREDYEKLVSIATDKFRYFFEFQITDTEKDFFVGFGKLRNSRVTIFFKEDAGKAAYYHYLCHAGSMEKHFIGTIHMAIIWNFQKKG